MSKFELSLAKDYVEEWTYLDAIRELFQNAVDQEAIDMKNQMFFEYVPETETLSIGNRLSVLDKASLLLGSSSKRDDSGLIGKFGEGYKLATLVLTREGHKVTFYNYGAKEVWSPRFVNSRRYQAEVLTFFIDKKYPWQGVPNNNLIIEVEGITPKQYAKIRESNLHLLGEYEKIPTSRGEILLDPRLKGMAFVNGLYICRLDTSEGPFSYGYNFNPEWVSLDRDRRMISTFEASWETSQMWLAAPERLVPQGLIADLVMQGKPDVQYITSSHSSMFVEAKRDLADTVYRNFREEHGERAVPVTSQSELSRLRSKGDSFTPVIVNRNTMVLVEDHPEYEEPEEIVEVPIHDQMETWLSVNEIYLPEEAITSFRAIMKQLV